MTVERTADDLAGILERLDAAPCGRPRLLARCTRSRSASPSRIRASVRRLVLESPSAGLATAAERIARRRADLELATAIEDGGIAAFVARWEAQPIFASQAALPPARVARLRAMRLANDPSGLAASLRGAGQGAMEPLFDHLRGRRRPDARHRRRPRHRSAARGPSRSPPASRAPAWPSSTTPATRPTWSTRPRSAASSSTSCWRIPPHEHARHLDARRRVPGHPLRALGHRHRQGDHQPPRGPQRLPPADRARADRRLRPDPRRRVRRLRPAHRRGRQGLLLRRRPEVQEPRRRLPRHGRHRPPQRPGPAAPDPLPADPGHRARQRLRHRRRPRAPHRVRHVDRVRQRDLRPGRPEGRQLRRRVRGGAAGAAGGRQEGQGDLVPVPPVLGGRGAGDAPRQQGRAAGGPRGRGRRSGRTRSWT